jgi:hypothetical protein
MYQVVRIWNPEYPGDKEYEQVLYEMEDKDEAEDIAFEENSRAVDSIVIRRKRK